MQQFWARGSTVSHLQKYLLGNANVKINFMIEKEKEILLKLKALKKHIDNSYKNYSQIKVEDYEKYISVFDKYLNDLKNLNSTLYDDFAPSVLTT
ncbi:MAG: hypothetical protein ABI863_11170 [Ginsengibacter sp.]